MAGNMFHRQQLKPASAGNRNGGYPTDKQLPMESIYKHNY